MPEAACQMEGGLSPTPRLSSLFAGFFSIGIVGFGGVLPWARRMIVEQRMWLTPSEFNDLLALCQFLPGPNIVNMAVALGGRFRGVAGSAACLVGLLAAPMVIVILLGGKIYLEFRDLPAIGRGFAGLAAAASGLVVTMAIKVAASLSGSLSAMIVAAIAFLAIAVLHLPLLPTMLTVSHR